MGQAFRRATGRIASSRVDTKSQLGKIVEQRPPPPTPPPVVPVDKLPTDDVTPGSGNLSTYLHFCLINFKRIHFRRDVCLCFILQFKQEI